MAMPKSVMKYDKKGLRFESSVDKVQYTLEELTRAALRDVATLIRKDTRAKIKKKTGRLSENMQTWVPKSRAMKKHGYGQVHLQVGFKPGGFYGMYQEFGTEKTPKIGALHSSVVDNIPMIIAIQSQYLSAMEDEARALSLINEAEEVGDDSE